MAPPTLPPRCTDSTRWRRCGQLAPSTQHGCATARSDAGRQSAGIHRRQFGPPLELPERPPRQTPAIETPRAICPPPLDDAAGSRLPPRTTASTRTRCGPTKPGHRRQLGLPIETPNARHVERLPPRRALFWTQPVVEAAGTASLSTTEAPNKQPLVQVARSLVRFQKRRSTTCEQRATAARAIAAPPATNHAAALRSTLSASVMSAAAGRCCTRLCATASAYIWGPLT